MKTIRPLQVRVPGSSANLGPGFDVLGMALTLYADIGIADHSSADRSRPLIEGRHPALLAFRAAGGTGDLWVHSSIPSGRGLGFSGAVRVGAVALGLAERSGVIGGELEPFIAEHRQPILDLAAEMEGHGDNVAASLFGGVVACAEVSGRFVSTTVPLSRDIVSNTHIVVWIPHEQTATSESRATLGTTLSRDAAVFNLSRMAQLILAFGSEDSRASRTAFMLGVEDRIHQDQRLEKVPNSRRALEVMGDTGAVAAWLSGSGPTVAALVRDDAVDAVERALGVNELETAGRVMRLAIDTAGLQAAR